MESRLELIEGDQSVNLDTVSKKTIPVQGSNNNSK